MEGSQTEFLLTFSRALLPCSVLSFSLVTSGPKSKMIYSSLNDSLICNIITNQALHPFHGLRLMTQLMLSLQIQPNYSIILIIQCLPADMYYPSEFPLQKLKFLCNVSRVVMATPQSMPYSRHSCQIFLYSLYLLVFILNKLRQTVHQALVRHRVQLRLSSIIIQPNNKLRALQIFTQSQVTRVM